jgi:AraC-like DNA-binding protein/quercetin dioxygenase-like cupin family protein
MMREKFTISRRCREAFLGETAEGVLALERHDCAGGGLSELQPPYVIERHDSPDHVCLFTISGEGILRIPGNGRNLKPGSLCVLPAGGNHLYCAQGRWKLLWFHLARGAAWRTLVPAQATLVRASCLESLQALGREFLTESTGRERPGRRQMLDGLARLMALLLQRELQRLEPSTDELHRRELERLWSGVSQNPAYPWTVAELARAARLSRSHLQARVVHLHGCGVMDMVRRLRMERATSLLLLPQLKLEEIGGRVGYDSPFSFSRAFKRVMGVAPNDYRRRRRPVP